MGVHEGISPFRPAPMLETGSEGRPGTIAAQTSLNAGCRIPACCSGDRAERPGRFQKDLPVRSAKNCRRLLGLQSPTALSFGYAISV